MKETFVHSTAIVEKGAELGQGVHIGPHCLIGAQSRIGDECVMRSHVVVEGNTKVGHKNVFHPFSTIGGPPQDLSYQLEDTCVEIGDENVFRESVTIHRGTVKGRQKTVVGSKNMFMAYSHVAHDCIVGSDNIFANSVSLAGHVDIGDCVVIGGLVGITQFVRVGSFAFLGAGTILRKDLPPYMAAKNFSEVMGPNLVGLRRRGVSNENIRVISELYKVFYKSGKILNVCLSEIESRYKGHEIADGFIEFVNTSKVGIQR